MDKSSLMRMKGILSVPGLFSYAFRGGDMVDSA